MLLIMIHCKYSAIRALHSRVCVWMLLKLMACCPVVSESQEAEKMDTDSDSQQGDKVRPGEDQRLLWE